jgi:hypothetical protein
MYLFLKKIGQTYEKAIAACNLKQKGSSYLLALLNVQFLWTNISGDPTIRHLSRGKQVRACLSPLAMFACLIIRTFQLVFSAGIIFFSHNKSTNNTFSHGFQRSERALSPPILHTT